MNPYIPLNDYTPDGEPHVFGSRVYLYSSHDKERGETFCMLDYVFYSAPLDDLSSWTAPGIAYSVKEDPLSLKDPSISMYAPDCVQGNDGKYYLYYCCSGDKGSTGYSYPISVAVSDLPDRDFHFYGYVKNADGTVFQGDYVNFDPAVINDNGVIRLYFGAYYPFKLYHLPKKMIQKINTRIFGRENVRSGAWNTVLKDDMLTMNGPVNATVTEEATLTEFRKHPFFEASSIRKVGDLYYFIWSSWYNHELCYATSKDPTGDFRYRGVIVSNGDVGINGRTLKNPACPIGNNHGSIEKLGDQWYVFYHRQTHDTSYSRQACVEPIVIHEDGSIPQVEITSQGFDGALRSEGTFEAARYCMLTNGKGRLVRNGKGMGKHPYLYSDGDGSFIHAVDDRTVIGYKYFDFTGPARLSLTLRGHAEGKLKICAGEKIIAEIPLSLNRDTWEESAADIQYTGTAALYFRYTGKGNFDLKKFSFR